ncbi:MAG TPA: large conductance mechanosensitive channel protein MscL [Candidatus Paceibacterota bacterium]|jgi:large conductance mechanosensitive channel|nr:large conductance mechanosensitive channel protein MscL [Candidatus Paceibacterota bacterium]
MKSELASTRGFIGEFKKFIARGSVVDLAVGIIIGGGFNTVVSSLVNDIVMPPIGHIVGKVDFKDLYVNLSGTPYDSLTAAKAAGAATINYGNFLNNVISFLITAFAVFLLVKFINRLRDMERKKKQVEAPAPTTKDCPFCFTSIPARAVKCPACTSDLQAK